MDPSANEPLEPMRLFLRSLQAAMGAAGPATARPPQLDAAHVARQWLAALGGPWAGAAAAAAPPDLWARLLGVPNAGADLTDVWSHWYAANSEALARALDELLRAPEFVGASARALDEYASAVAAQRRAAETAARALPFATRADVTRLARLVIATEEKLDRVLDAGQAAAGDEAVGLTASVTSLAGRLDAIEAKLDRLIAAGEHATPGQRAASAHRNVSVTAATAKTPATGKPTGSSGARRTRGATSNAATQPVRLVRGKRAR